MADDLLTDVLPQTPSPMSFRVKFPFRNVARFGTSDSPNRVYMKTTLFGLFGKVEIAAKQLRDSLVYFKLKVVGAMVVLVGGVQVTTGVGR